MELPTEASSSAAGSDGSTPTWTGLRDLVLWSVYRMANDRGLTQVLTAAGHGHRRLDRQRARLDPLFDEWVARAQTAGALRPDVTSLDLMIALTLTSRIGAPGDPGARERHATLLLDGPSAHRDSPTAMPAPATTASVRDGGARPDDPVAVVRLKECCSNNL
ncbi:hypothetical protein SAMN05660657_05433 [Geodermatophilus amargosae]|uniref:Transcriptional regulator SbtR-like C-terminal domain-containing protein n=1 Tax=Geodermatophilus amargosae TaxID=1296565 RepID=A0A1I7D7R8_9ACTN|nr:hypothetical protein [Geodermatophilus amargosae]SFU07701.1 hypothetical protein SAMN05660657_05433 [Geodermatophilus amargosae]